MASPNSSSQGSSPSAASTHFQDQLLGFCRTSGLRTPTWQVVSDRRGTVAPLLPRFNTELTVLVGGRTAWSCFVTVSGQQFSARFWYDGQFVHNAKEDAAEVALQRLGQLPHTGHPPVPVHHQQSQQQPQSQGQQQQQQSQARQNAGGQGHRFHGVISG